MKKGTVLGYKYCSTLEWLWQEEHRLIMFSSALFSVAHDKESELLPVETVLSHKHSTILLMYTLSIIKQQLYYREVTESQKPGHRKNSLRTGHILCILLKGKGIFFSVNTDTLGSMKENFEKMFLW